LNRINTPSSFKSSITDQNKYNGGFTMEQLLNNLNELKGAMENLTDNDLIEMRMNLLTLIDECLESIKEQ
jgi:hypothetical protein